MRSRTWRSAGSGTTSSGYVDLLLKPLVAAALSDGPASQALIMARAVSSFIETSLSNASIVPVAGPCHCQREPGGVRSGIRSEPAQASPGQGIVKYRCR
jgi:hypothetical protein